MGYTIGPQTEKEDTARISSTLSFHANTLGEQIIESKQDILAAMFRKSLLQYRTG